MKIRNANPTADTASNFNGFGETTANSTLDALKAAVQGETGASAKYAAYAKAADENGFPQLAKLFRATSAAEQIHINLEAGLAEQMDPSYKRPEPPASIDVPATDLSIIDAAKGEIFETSDMYPAFIKKAQEEGQDRAVTIFTRAKLAEGVHAERYLAAYNDLDAADDDDFFLCPGCGYIEKGSRPDQCPICGAPGSKFQAF